MSSFQERVLRVVGKIKKGKTMTYKEVAQLSGNKRAARAVGNILAKNFDPKIPCYRVIKSDGSPGSYNRGGTRAKIKLLRREGAIK